MNSNMIGNKDKVCRFNAKQIGIYIHLLNLMSTIHFCHFVLFSKGGLSYRYLAGSSFWIKVKTSCFIKTRKNKLNLKSGNPKIMRFPTVHAAKFLSKKGQERLSKRFAIKKERKAKEKENKNQIRNQSKWKKNPTFFSDMNQSSKSYCQEQLRASSAHVQPDWFICFLFSFLFSLKLGTGNLEK